MNKPVILIIENSHYVTGALKSIVRCAVTLKNEFQFVMILPSAREGAEYVSRFDIPVVTLPMIEIRKSPAALIRYLPTLIQNVFSLRKVLRRMDAKLILSNDFYNLLPAVYRSLGGKVPYITFVRFLPLRFPYLLRQLWFRSHLSFAHSIIAVSNAVLKDLPRSRKNMMIYNELPVEAEFQVYPYPFESKTILCVSNYIAGKGLEDVLDCFAAVAAEFPDFTLRLVGGDLGLVKNSRYKLRLQQRALSLGLTNRVVFANFSDNVVQEYKQAALILNFSESESFSLTCIEASFVGRPVIATRCGGPEEIVKQGESGELVGIKNLQEMQTALRKLLLDPLLRERYGIKGHQIVRERFNINNTVLRLVPILRAAIQDKN